jgi:methanethiol S-methyltransferase
MARRGGRPGRVAAIVAAYALAHSLLASRQAKDAARRLLGARLRDGTYRLLYNAQALALFGLGIAAYRRLPDRTLYRVRAPWSWAMHGGQLAGVGLATWAAAAVGPGDMSGLGPLAALLRGDRPAREPEAQGPAIGPDGEMRVRGPFRYTRHPANWGPLLAVLLFPRMTVNRAALAVASVAYLVLGSLHEERRLLAAHGEAYRRYRARVPFLLGPTRLGRMSVRGADAGGRGRPT